MHNQPHCLRRSGIYKPPAGGWLDQGQRFECVARAHLDCGYVMSFLRAEAAPDALAALVEAGG